MGAFGVEEGRPVSLLKRILGPNQPPPEWAAFFKPPDWTEFVGAVEKVIAGHGTSYRLDAEEGVIYLLDAGGAEQKLGLGNLAQLCHINPRRRWKEIIHNH